MDIEEWKRKLEGAEPDGWCNLDVPCQICRRASASVLIELVEILKVQRSGVTYFYCVCVDCQAELGINNRGVG